MKCYHFSSLPQNFFFFWVIGNKKTSTLNTSFNSYNKPVIMLSVHIYGLANTQPPMVLNLNGFVELQSKSVMTG